MHSKEDIKGNATPAGSVSDEDASQLDFQSEEDHYSLQTGIKSLFRDQPKVYKDILKCIHLYTLGIISINELEEAIENPFEELDVEKEKDKLIKVLASRCKSRRQLSWCCRSLSDLIHVKCKRMGSYLHLPEDYPDVISTGRNSLLASELNNAWISVASGSEDSSFKVTRRNIYEEQLCKCEDERFEHDMAINCCDFIINALENTLSEIPKHEDQ